MEIKQKASQLLRIAMLACTLLAGIAILVATLTQYDNGTAYFMVGAWLPAVAVSLALLGGLLGTVGAILARKEDLSDSPFGNNLPSPLAIGGLVASILMLWKYMTQGRAIIDLILALLLVLLTVYALLSSFAKLRESHATALVFLGFAAMLGCMLIAIVCYFDMSLEMNAPAKVSTQVALLVTAVYFTAEIRYLLRAPLPKLLLVLLSWIAPLGALAVCSTIPLLLLGELTDRTYAATSALLLGMLALIPLRMHALKKAPVSPSEEETEGEKADSPDTPTDDANGEDLT